jgi:hypothetical protein
MDVPRDIEEHELISLNGPQFNDADHVQYLQEF